MTSLHHRNPHAIPHTAATRRERHPRLTRCVLIGGRLTLTAAALLLATTAEAQRYHPPSRTVAQLGTCSDPPHLVYVTDGASSTDCTTGGGSTDVLCACADGSWTAVVSSGGGIPTTGTANTVLGYDAAGDALEIGPGDEGEVLTAHAGSEPTWELPFGIFVTRQTGEIVTRQP